MGGDLRHLDRPTLDLLTNPEVIAVNQASSDNQPHFVEDGIRMWSARAPGKDDRYLALFNTDKIRRAVRVDLDMLGLAGQVGVRDLWARVDLKSISNTLAEELPSHGAGLYRLTPM